MSKDSRKNKIVVLIWLLITGTPTTILMYKLSIYLLETSFKEWWVAIIFSLVIPSTMSIAILNKEERKTKKVGNEE